MFFVERVLRLQLVNFGTTPPLFYLAFKVKNIWKCKLEKYSNTKETDQANIYMKNIGLLIFYVLVGYKIRDDGI